jgi:RNA polymerase sporulation-specific sigma factor
MPETRLIQQAKSGNKDALNKLIHLHLPLIQRSVSMYEKAPIPRTAILGHGMQLAATAVDRFDPTKEASFTTHLTATLRGLNRYVEGNKRIDRVPENKRLRIGRLMAVSDTLRLERGREPTVFELADNLGWSPKHVAEIQQATQQKSYAASGLENVSDHQVMTYAKLKEKAEMHYFSWSHEEQLIYDYLMGAHGKTRVSDVKRLIQMTGLSSSKIYRIREKLSKQLS